MNTEYGTPEYRQGKNCEHIFLEIKGERLRLATLSHSKRKFKVSDKPADGCPYPGCGREKATL